jgi:quercetin dioxygenase-like cupin family protein
MIHRHFKQGQRLNVADLNEIIVLVDRSETELTEVALNSWRPGLDGPPHFHDQKEQLFFITQGSGTVRIGDATCPAATGDLFYVPAGVIHQTITGQGGPLEYLLFNAFLNEDKEGHGSFADHIEKVKATRRLQAQTQQAGDRSRQVSPTSQAKGRHFPSVLSTAPSTSGKVSRTLLLNRAETRRCEAIFFSCPPNSASPRESDPNVEQTIFILDGAGNVAVGGEVQSVKHGDVVFVPRNTPFAVETGSDRLNFLALGTIVQ